MNPIFVEVAPTHPHSLTDETGAINHSETKMPVQNRPSALAAAAADLRETAQDRRENDECARSYAKSSAAFEQDRAETFGDVLAAQRAGVGDGALAGWLDALDRGSQKK